MRYQAKTKVRINAGSRVLLSEAQAFDRRHLVTLPAADGFCNVLLPFDFKAGEIFELDGDLPKGMAEPVEPMAAAEQDAPAAAARRERKTKAA